MLPRLDGHLGIAGVLVVRHGQIDHVHVLQQLKIVGGMLGDAVDQKGFFPFQPVYQRGGELQVVAEKGGELPFPLGGQV